MTSIITLTTDFGTGSPYVAQMKGVILSINAAAQIIDISHAVPPQDIRYGAIVLSDVAPRFPDDTLHVAVVDPGVGSNREIVYVRAGGHAYIAPDNGLLSRVLQRAAAESIIALSNPAYWLPSVSATFHGRDIMAPVAAHLSLGVAAKELGPPRHEVRMIQWPEVRLGPRVIQGTVMQVDSFGNLVSDITGEHMARIPGEAVVTVACQNHTTQGLDKHYSQRAAGTLVALFGSAGYLELAVCGGSAATTLGANVGDPIQVSW